MSEDALWARTREKLSIFGKLERVENLCAKGTPDVSYCLRIRRETPVTGWLELKHEAEWPVRTSTPIRIHSLTLEQVRWQQEWETAGGRVVTLLQIKHTILILRVPALAKLYYLKQTKNSLIRDAEVVAERSFPTGDLLRILTET